MEGQAYIYIYISITKASKVPTQIFSLVRWFGPHVLFFLDHTVQLRHSQRTHTHTPMNTRTQTLPL